MKRNSKDSQETDNEGQELADKLDTFSIKCTTVEKAKLKAAMRNLNGAEFARLLTSLLVGAGFSLNGENEVPEFVALKAFLMQMLSDCSQKIAVSLDGLGNQVLESKSNMAKSRSEAAARHADLEAELKQRHLEISDLNNRVGSLMRENASLAESIEKANRVIQLLEGQISEKSIQNETLRKQIENQPQLVDRFNILTDQLQEVKAEIKKSWANTPVSNET